MAFDLSVVTPPDFPPLLREIPQSPKQLYVRGTLPSFDIPWLAVVGSRACTAYGERALKYLIEGLRGYPVVIVSGGGLSKEQQAQLAEFGQRLIAKGSLNEKELLSTIERALQRITK